MTQSDATLTEASVELVSAVLDPCRELGGLRRDGVRRGGNAAHLRSRSALCFLQKKALLPAEARSAGLRGFGRRLQGLGRPDLGGNWTNARKAFDQRRMNFLRPCGFFRRCAGIFRFRFCHAVVGENFSPNIRSP